MATITIEGPNPKSPQETTTLQVEVPDGTLLDVVQALCRLHGYKETIDGQENPEGPGMFAMRMSVENYWRAVVREDKLRQARAAAEEQIDAELAAALQQIGFE